MSQGGWKKHLLRSGIPLEYEVAQLLAKHEMSISADFSFMRRDGIATKESSVDIQADWYDSDSANFVLHLLIECKYRSRNKSILFLPDPNELYSPVTLGGTVQSFDFTSPCSIPLDSFVDLDRLFQYTYKCIEISDEGAFEEQIWHGIQQLRYGIPITLRNSFQFNILNHPEDATPEFFSCILVTNAPIRVLKEGCTIQNIEDADSLEEISEERDCVILFSDYGPDYEDHVRSIFDGSSEICGEAARDRLNELTSLGKEMNITNNPVKIFEELERAERYLTYHVSTQFFVVTLAGLDALLKQIKKYCLSAYANRVIYEPSN